MTEHWDQHVLLRPLDFGEWRPSASYAAGFVLSHMAIGAAYLVDRDPDGFYKLPIDVELKLFLGWTLVLSVLLTPFFRLGRRKAASESRRAIVVSAVLGALGGVVLWYLPRAEFSIPNSLAGWLVALVALGYGCGRLSVRLQA